MVWMGVFIRTFERGPQPGRRTNDMKNKFSFSLLFWGLFLSIYSAGVVSFCCALF